MTRQDKTKNSKKEITLLAYMGNFIENIKYMREYVYIQSDYRLIVPSNDSLTSIDTETKVYCKRHLALQWLLNIFSKKGKDEKFKVETTYLH